MIRCSTTQKSTHKIDADVNVQMTSRHRHSPLSPPLQYDLHHKLITIKLLITTYGCGLFQDNDISN